MSTEAREIIHAPHLSAPPPRAAPADKPVGLGDAVAAVAQPIARVLDAVLHTKIANCQPCIGPGGRKDKLNQLVPDIFSVSRKSKDIPPASHEQ